MLTGKTVPAEALSGEQIRTMYDIMVKYYDNILWENFTRDLKEKSDAILLCDEDNKIFGFTTLAVFSHDENTRLLYSGDTIVEKEYWGSNDLSYAWITNALSRAAAFKGKTYWLLLTKGYKTYKYLHTFFNTFYPRADTETPEDLQFILDKFGREHFGDKYKDGVYIEGRDFLKEEFAAIDESKLRDKNTAFFLKKNPNYKNGDELVCICELNENNLNKTGRRILEKQKAGGNNQEK